MPKNSVKSLGATVRSATIRVVPDLLKARAIPLDTTVRRSAFDGEDLKPYQKSEERQLILLFTSLILLQE